MRNLEEAYKKSIQEETPDLWARIEEKLPEKKKKKKIISITRYMGVAAAALFLCLLIPGVLRIAGGTKNADSSAEMAFDAATSFDSANAAAQVTEGAEGSKMENDTSQDASTKEFFSMDSAEGGMDEGKNDVNDSYSTEEEKGFDSVIAENMELGDEETLAIGSAKIETLQQNLTVQEIVQYNEYKILVLFAMDGTVFRVQVPEDDNFSFAVGENYDFALQKQEGEEWEYLLISAE